MYGGSGFNSEAAMLQTAYELYNKLVGNYNRQAIVSTLNQFLAMQGIDTQIILKPLSFLDDKEMANTTTKVSDETDDVSEDNIEEKQVGNTEE